jgi:hypothetical protein
MTPESWTVLALVLLPVVAVINLGVLHVRSWILGGVIGHCG